jgi:hypothetical protein
MDDNRIARLEARLDRIDAVQQIGQLASRYAFALDSRDFPALGTLYVEDLEGGGRAAVERDIARTLRAFYRTMHQVVGHQIDLIDADHATGRVYTRAEHEQGDDWIDMAICYFDAYERRGGAWYFARRRQLHHLHVSWLADRPVAPFLPSTPWTDGREPLPEAWGASWREYWSESSTEEIAALTRKPVEERP